jgi:hypothetical protein
MFSWFKKKALNKGVPDREGFVTGELATLAPCPPFPEFTDFEQKALDSIASLFGPDEIAFRQQVATARVLDRINTGVGFYTRIEIDRLVCQRLPIRARGGNFEVDNIEHGVGVVLWDDGGYLDQMEGFTYGADQLRDVALEQLTFLRMVGRFA